MGEDGSVVIGVDMNVSEAEKELARLKRKILDTEESIGKTKFRKNELLESLKEAQAELEKIQSQTQFQKGGPLGVRAIVTSENAARMKELELQITSIENEIEKCNTKIRDGNIQLEYTKQRYGEVAEEAGRVPPEVERSADFLDKFSKRVMNLAKRVFVFTLITQALRSMRDWMGKTVKTNSEATAAIAKLKGALLTLAQPLVEVIIPAFITLINVLTAIIGAVAQFISLLFGTSVSKSAEAAKSLYEEQNALQGVGAAAEDAAGSLAGFDEINTIQTEKSGGGGGGAAGADIAPDFSWTDGLSERLDKIAKLVLLIGAGFALWKLGSSLPGILGTIATSLGLILMAVGGILLFWDGLTDAWENGVDWLNLIEMVGGLAIAAFALYELLGPIAAGILLVVGGLAMLVTAFHDAMENGWNLQNTLLAIAGLFAAGLGISLLTGSWIPLLIGAIAGLLLAITVATGHGEELIDGIRDILEGFKDFFTGIFTGDIEKAVGGLEKIFQGLGKVFDAVIDGVRDLFLSFLDWLDEKTNGKFHGIIETAKNFVTGFFDHVKTTLNNILSAVKQILTGIIQFVSGVFTGDWDRAWEGVKNIFKGIWNGIVSLLEGGINLIVDGVNWLIKQMNKLSINIPDFLGGGTLGINIQSISPVSIPRLATGGVIPPNREFMAVLGDNKRESEIVSPLSTMKQAFLEAMRESGGAGGGDIHITVELDGKVVARQTVKHINDMTRQSGKPVLLY